MASQAEEADGSYGVCVRQLVRLVWIGFGFARVGCGSHQLEGSCVLFLGGHSAIVAFVLVFLVNQPKKDYPFVLEKGPLILTALRLVAVPLYILVWFEPSFVFAILGHNGSFLLGFGGEM